MAILRGLNNDITYLQALLNNLIVLNQSAYIEWKRGGGSEAAMENWIGSNLAASSNIPERKNKFAAEYNSENRVKYQQLIKKQE